MNTKKKQHSKSSLVKNLAIVKISKIKSLFIALSFLAFLPLALACGDEQMNSIPITANVISGSNMASGFYGMDFFVPLIMILVIISLVLFIVWIIKNLKEKKK